MNTTRFMSLFSYYPFTHLLIINIYLIVSSWLTALSKLREQLRFSLFCFCQISWLVTNFHLLRCWCSWSHASFSRNAASNSGRCVAWNVFVGIGEEGLAQKLRWKQSQSESETVNGVTKWWTDRFLLLGIFKFVTRHLPTQLSTGSYCSFWANL